MNGKNNFCSSIVHNGYLELAFSLLIGYGTGIDVREFNRLTRIF